ncbi:MAG: cation diffusion facilitator family transporter [Erysipelotrichaceae bacterium]|nr:cation diffusion facilitator family transporter [Erysipelotrichaceae bacterium]
MTNFILKTFMKDYSDNKDSATRKKAGFLSSTVGIVCNIILFVSKFIIGTIANSVAIISDAFNNLTDCLSCIITMFGYNLASKPADKEHPFGHGRMEYFTSLIIAVFIIIVGFEFFKTSLSRIFNKEEMDVTYFTIIVLVLSILLKFWMYLFNKKMSTIFNNQAMMATSYDSLSDAMTTSITLIGSIISLFTDFPIDGVIGLIVSGLIIKTAISIIKDTLDELLGKPADKETTQQLLDIVMSHQGILGVHDLMIHNYGPNNMIASLHAEVDAKQNVLEAHDTIDNIEKEIFEKMKIMTTIHLDPIETDNIQLNQYKTIVRKVLNEIDPELSFHDFRMVVGQTHTNLIFDVIISDKYRDKNQMLKEKIDEQLKLIDNKLETVITFDSQF